MATSGVREFENGRGPVIVFRPGDDLQRRAGFFRQTLPRIVVGRELLFEHENALAFFDRQISRGGCDAVAGRGNDGDAVGRAVEELRGGRAKFFRAGKELIGRNLPRVCFAGKRRGSGLQRRLHQR